MARRKRNEQLEFEFRSWGGARKGAGRKRKAERAQVPHRAREPLKACHPVHVTVRLKKGLPSLRKRAAYRVVLRAFEAGAQRFGFRLAQYSVQTNHLHLLAEADDRNALSRGIKGLLVRTARALNRLWDRRGSVFAGRYHDRILKTPREVRNALVYVLQNARRHGIHFRGLDPFSSAEWFDGWCEHERRRGWSPVSRARSWLLNVGWRRHGRLRVTDAPAC